MPTAGVSREDVANTISTVIHEQAIVPLMYNVPLHEVADVWKLPREGDVLRIPRIVETPLSSVANLSKESIYTIASSDGIDDFAFQYSQFTILERALYSVVNKWATYTSPMDMAKIAGNRLINAAGRLLNRDAYMEACGAFDSDFVTTYGSGVTGSGGFQWLRADGANTSATGELRDQVVGATVSTTTCSCAALTEADHFWRYGQITFTSGKNAGLSRRITAFATTGDLITFDELPVAPVAGDTFNITVLGNGTISDTLATSDTITLPLLYKAHERCRRYGAGAAQMTGPMLDVTGVARDRSGMIPQGIAFLPTSIAHDLRVATSGTAANTNNFWMTDAAVQRAFGGNLGKIGGLLIAEVNHNVRCSVADGTFSLTTGVAWPSLVMYETGFGCTTLASSGTGDRQGLDITTKIPSPNDIAIKYKSIKMQVEMDIINRYFVCNSLRGCVLWTGTTTA